MIGVRPQERPGRLTIQLLRLQYWYDRLSDPRRLLVGLGAILFLAASLLYVLGLTTTVLVSRMELRPEAAPATDAAPAPVVEAQPTPAPNQPTPVPATPTATPAVDSSGDLIQPPDVPEVAIIPAPPRIYEPQPQLLKPRVVATPAATARTVAPTAATAQATRPATNGAAVTPGPTLPRTVVPTNGTARTPTPARAQQPAPQVTQQAGSTATRPPLNTPAGPTAAPKVATPTPATKPR